MASVAVQPANDFRFFPKLFGYSYVSSALEKSKGVYTWGKESSKVVAFAETSLEEGLKWVQEKAVNPVLETQTYKNYAQPLLVKADSFGTTALDKVETSAQRLQTSYDSTKQVVEQKVNTAKTTASTALEQAQQKFVSPVDNYLKDSLVSRPYVLALDAVEKYLPSDKTAGPISRTTHLVVTVQNQTLAKLQALKQAERPKSLDYPVELLKQAAHALDNGVFSLGQTVGKGVANGTTLVKEAPKEVKDKVQKATHEAITKIQAALEAVNSRLPTPVSTKLKQLTDAAKKEGQAELNLFSSVAQSSSKLLHDVSNNLKVYAQKGEVVPQQLLSNSFHSVQRVLESLLSLVSDKKHDKESKEEPAVENIGGSN